jgi:anti-sigma factor RsiW
MNCDEARPLVGASVDRELSAGDEWRLREHLAGCVDCARAADAVRLIGRAVRSASYYRAPAALGARIAAALGSAPAAEEGKGAGEQFVAGNGGHAGNAGAGRAGHVRRPPPRRRGWRWGDLLRPSSGNGGAENRSRTGGAQGVARPLAAIPMGWMAAALLVLAALGAAVTVNLRESPEQSAFVDELVASHVRAQLSGRALDVPSSDRHTVKPWFNGRIDYAPPVEDLAAAGFPLVGGRLDYVGGERVAVLVYRYRLHVIDVYVFPSGTRAASGATAPPLADGFALARWERDGMTWWAVTDGGPDVLAAFRSALDARLRGG